MLDVQSWSRFFALLTLVADAIVLGSVALVVTRASEGRLGAALREHALLIAWLIALTSTLGSLYYSEGANFIPCELCWYQRIAMYPLAIVLGIAAWRRDLRIRVYAVPVVAIGAAISIYHYTLQRFPDLSSGACDPTAPCTLTYVWEFHFISIPFMALSGFAAIAALLLRARPQDPEIEGDTEGRS